MGESALYNATDEKAFQRDTASTLAEVESKGALLGWDRDTIDNAKAGELSKRWSQRILGLSRTDPQQANTMLEKAMEDHTIQAQDYYKVQGHVLQQLHTQGSRNISDSVNNGWAPYMTAPEIQRATGVDDTLLRVVKKAQQDNPNLQFTIGAEGGRRSQSEQDRLYAQGRTAPGNVVTYTRSSDHLDGRAIDLVAKSGTNQAAVTAAMEKASADLGIPLAQKSAAFASFDPGHYALPKDYNVKNAPQPVEQPLKDRVAAAEDFARRTQPNDTMFSDAVRDRVISDFNRGKAIQRDADYTNGNTVTGGVIGSYGGKLPTTVEELKALDPKVAAAWDGLDNIKQQKYLRYLSQNAKGDTSWTQEGLRQFAALRSMASGDDTDRQAFLGTDVLGLQGMTNAAKLQLNALQQKSLKVPDDDPALNKAISYLGTKMFNAGVTRGQDKDRYYDFRGALQDQLQTFQQDHKKMTGPKEWDEIGSKLLQEQSAPWMFGLFNSKTSTFEVPVPDKDQAEIKQFLTEKNKGTEPSDKDIQRFWIAVQYQRLYGKKDAGK
jgi:hypothetical protein